MTRKVVVNDRMQRGYTHYRAEPVGRNFALGFAPELTPKQMLALGVFGGKYMTDCRDEFPSSWFVRDVRRAARSTLELLRRQRLAVAGRVASQAQGRFASTFLRVCQLAFALPDAYPNKELTDKVVKIGHRMGRKNVRTDDDRRCSCR